MGNHEFYKYYDIANLNDGFCLEIRPNVHSYYNAVVHVEDIDFIVTTLWSKIPLKEAYYTEQVISDFRRIFFNEELLTFLQTSTVSTQGAFSVLKEAVSSSNARKKIVVTHHVPSFQMQCPKFAEQSG